MPVLTSAEWKKIELLKDYYDPILFDAIVEESLASKKNSSSYNALLRIGRLMENPNFELIPKIGLQAYFKRAEKAKKLHEKLWRQYKVDEDRLHSAITLRTILALKDHERRTK